MKLYRSILLDQDEDINTNNIGNSWTLCEIFAENHAKDINGDLKKDGFVVLQADVNEDQIDWSNTLNAMENRGYEFEVVIRGNIKATVLMVEGIDFDEYAVIEGNAGDNTFEDYYDNYDGELTKEDLLLLSLEF
jgi:hypothetical protein